MRTWQVQAAKQRFSEVLRAVEAGEPQFITKHGKPVAVIVDFDEYRKSHVADRSFSQFLAGAARRIELDDELPISPRAVDPVRLDSVVADLQ